MNFNSAKQSNNNNNIKMSATNSNTNTCASAILGQGQGKENELLDLYIPRASLKTTDRQVKDLLFRCQIGIVEYCDLVIIKDKETKEPLHMSVFLKLESWDPFSNARADFNKNGSLNLFLGQGSKEFWMLLPNKTPLPRSHVNTSQLAASTEKLFEQTEQLTEKTNKIQQDQAEQMEEMRYTIRSQQDQIETLEFKIKIVEEEAQMNYSVLMNMVQRLTRQMSVLNMDMYGADTEDGIQQKLIESRDFLDKHCTDRIKQDMEQIEPIVMDRDEYSDESDAEPLSISIQLLPSYDMDEDLEKEEKEYALPPPPALTRTMTMSYHFNDKDVEEEAEDDEDEYLPIAPPKLTRTMTVAVPIDEDDCIFSRVPSITRVSVSSNTTHIQRVSTIQRTETRSSRSPSPEDSVRASISRDFCGNI